jgi:hypothetical protein
VDRYIIYRSLSPLPTDSVAAVAHPGSTYLDRRLDRGLYYYRVAAVDFAGNMGLYSQQDSAYCLGVKPRVESFGSEPSGDGVKLEWTVVDQYVRVLGCNLCRRDGCAGEPRRLNDSLLQPDDSQWGFLDNQVSVGQTYEYFVEIVLEGEDDVRFGPYRVETHRVGRDLVWTSPNPFQGVCSIHFMAEELGVRSVDIYDPSGRHIAHLERTVEEQGLCRFDWDGLDSSSQPAAPGIYFCRVPTDVGIRTCKVILLR